MPLLRTDPFNAVMLTSNPLVVSEEQKMYIREILDIACSDSKFAEKAYLAIQRVLTAGSTTVPVVTGLTPGSATIGDPSFTLHVNGTGFAADSKIVWNGSEEPTTFVSATELTTEVDMTTATTAGNISVAVLSSDGVLSEPQTFVLQPAGSPLMAAASKTVAAKPAAPVTTTTPAVKK